MNRTFLTLFLPILSLLLLLSEGWAETGPLSGADAVRAMSETFQATSRAVVPSVVKIVVRTGAGDKDGKKKPSLFGGLFSGFEDGSQEEGQDILGGGSGVLVDPSGIVLTNHHVIKDGDNISVELYDGRRFRVTSVKKDPLSDLAVLTLESKEPLPCLQFADSDNLEIGDWVLAIGNPFMLESSVSAGIISAKKRLLQKKERGCYIQTDAAINPGNSGGPLVNLRGEIVGINTAIATSSGGYQGVGFAIPANTARWIMKQLIEKGVVERAFLGVPAEPLSYEEAKSLGLPPREGVKAQTPYKNSPASKAGVRRNDIILAFDGKKVDSLETLQSMVECADIDPLHTLTVLRKGETEKVELPLKLEIKPEGYVGVPQSEKLTENGKLYADSRFGLLLIPMTDAAAERLGVPAGTGVVVLNVTPGGRGFRAGLRDGMVITRVNGTAVTSLEEYKSLVSAVSDGAECEIEAVVKKETKTFKL